MTVLARTQKERAVALRRLHHGPALLNLINVWDVASARTIARTPGCAAIATASAAIAASHGYDDGENIPLELHLNVLRGICLAVELPVTADLERGYGDVRTTVEAAIDAGIAGANLEDDMCPADQMRERIRDAVQAARAHRVPIVLNARTDVYLNRADWAEHAKLAEAIRRGRAYLDAGADCVFVPGCTEPESIRALVAAFGAGRASLLAVPGLADAHTLRGLGVARLSHGPFPHRRAMEALAVFAADQTSQHTATGSRGLPPASLCEAEPARPPRQW